MALFESKFAMTLLIVADIGLSVIGNGGQLTKPIACTCPGDIVTYICQISGSGFTIWRGSAFDCPTLGSRILLRHSLFGASSGAVGLCNNGAIIGRSLGIITNSMGNIYYTSQLMINLTVSSSVIGQTIECVHRNTDGMEVTIGSDTIEIIDPPPPPTNIQLVGISPERLIFNWTSVDFWVYCSSLRYNIISDCGTCPNTVGGVENSVICSVDPSTFTDKERQPCSFSVQSVLCGNIFGFSSTPLNVTLKVPQPPTIFSIIPQYNDTDRKLMDIDIKFNEVESFMISNGVDGSAQYYTISYSESSTGIVCDTLTISATLSCIQRICTVPSINPLPCSEAVSDGDIEILISASNSLGRGHPCSTTIGHMNKYVNITFESILNKLVCTFLDQQGSQSTVSCNLAYGIGPCKQCQEQNMTAKGTLTSPNTVSIDLLNIQQRSEYCFVVNASKGTFTILIKGLIVINADATTQPESSDENNQSERIITITVTVTVIIVTLLIFIINIVIMIYYCYGYNKRFKMLLAFH